MRRSQILLLRLASRTQWTAGMLLATRLLRGQRILRRLSQRLLLLLSLLPPGLLLQPRRLPRLLMARGRLLRRTRRLLPGVKLPSRLLLRLRMLRMSCRLLLPLRLQLPCLVLPPRLLLLLAFLAMLRGTAVTAVCQRRHLRLRTTTAVSVGKNRLRWVMQIRTMTQRLGSQTGRVDMLQIRR